MNVESKRKVIEVLLCGATIGCSSAAYHLDAEAWVAEAGIRARGMAQSSSQSPSSFMAFGIEAAYRMIESSTTLRREWFGAP